MGIVLGVIGWLLWALLAFMAIGQLSTARGTEDKSLRLVEGLGAVLFGAALVITLVPGVSKLHLLWAGPVLFVGPMFVTRWVLQRKGAKRGCRTDVSAEPVIGRDVSPMAVLKEVLRVVDFDRSDTVVGVGGQAIGASKFRPYGYLLVESPVLAVRSLLPINHRDDFGMAAIIEETSGWGDDEGDEELLVTYAPERVTRNGFAVKLSHTIHFALVPRGTLDAYYSKPVVMRERAFQDIFGQLQFSGFLKMRRVEKLVL